jgi:predicted dehydrogenase
MAKKKAGIIGTGFMAGVHIESIRKSGMGEVIAIAGASEEEAKAKAAEFGVDRTFDNYIDLIRDPDVEVVHSCTPNNLHFPINRAALSENKHVISEKPVAADSREARLLLSATERSAAVHAVTFNYRHHPVIEKLKTMAQKGELGEIYTVHGSYLQDWLLFDTDYNWRVDSELAGSTRVVADLGSHWCDLVQYVTGLKITEVIGDLRTFLPVRQKSVTTVGTFGRSTTPRLISVRVGTEDYGSVLLRFQKDVSGALTLSQVSAGSKNRLFFQIDGSKKSAAWDQERPEAPWLGHRDRPNELPPKKAKPAKKKITSYDHFPAGGGDAWSVGVDNFMRKVYEYISKGKKPGRDPASFATFKDGYEAVVLADKILASSRQGRWSKISME